jgi:Ca2+-binding EF-hand superfamily protein
MESVNNKPGKDNNEALLNIFKMFDRDSDGKISTQEFKAVMSSLVDRLTD